MGCPPRDKPQTGDLLLAFLVSDTPPLHASVSLSEVVGVGKLAWCERGYGREGARATESTQTGHLGAQENSAGLGDAGPLPPHRKDPC